MIYTIGPAKVYRAAQEIYGPQSKLGRTDDYTGGCVFRTVKDGLRYIDEKVEDDDPIEYTVFGLQAEWNVDTEPSEDGWWHYLLISRSIIIPPKDVDLHEYAAQVNVA